MPPQVSEKASPEAVTGSVKVTLTFVPRATSESPPAGAELSTSGPSSPGEVGLVISKFSGFPVFGPRKSAALSSVSCV